MSRLLALQICVSCAEQTGVNLYCAKCHTLYCSQACQKAHWTPGGHKEACTGLARARRDTNPGVQSRALACVSNMNGGAPGDARCLFRLGGGDAAEPLTRSCACWGSFVWSHTPCLVKFAEAARPPSPRELVFVPWTSCSTCKQRFTDLVPMWLATALWAKHAHFVIR